jgi:cation diffusion facilitator CzcD-associated flavoprotein CzcO
VKPASAEGARVDASPPTAGAAVGEAVTASARHPPAGAPAARAAAERPARDESNSPAPVERALADGRAPGRTSAGAPLEGASCQEELEAVRAQLVDIERRRRELDGDPIPAREDVPPRFRESGLVQTFNRAFQQTKIDGRVESVDCTEHPCILFGRLRGDEELVAKLEDSKPFQSYDEDIGVMLTWASGDRHHGGGAKPGLAREKPPEISLFAFAFYSHEDRERLGEAIDRRVRVRTAEYWNASDHRE